MRINYIHGLLNECVNDNLPPINYFYPYHFNTLFDIIQSSDDKFVIFEGRKDKKEARAFLKMKRKTILYSFKTSLPVMAGYIVLGMGFGILLQGKGFGWPWALGMSMTIYAGSMQYVAVDLLAGGASFFTTAIMTLTVNIRHLFYGVSMLSRYKNTGIYKPYLIFALTDETFSIACDARNEENVDMNLFYFCLSAFNQLYWIIGCVGGNLLGNIIPFSTDGIDFSMTALFLVILINQWESADDHKPVLTGLIVTLSCLLIFGGENFLIPSMIFITLALLGEKKIIKEDGEE